MQERQKAPIKIMYGIGQLMNLVWDKHPEYDKEAVLKEMMLLLMKRQRKMMIFTILL